MTIRKRGVLTFVDTVNEKAGKYTSLILPIMVSIIVLEVVARYIFNSPTSWVHELSGLIHLILIFVGGAWVLLKGEHVVVDIVYARFPPKVQIIVRTATSVVFFFLFGALLWTSAQWTWIGIQYGEHSHSHWGPLLWPFRILIPTGCVMIMAQRVVIIIRNLTLILKGWESG